MDLTVTVLGCGNSTGVPSIGDFWGACDPLEPKNRRTRSSIVVRSENTTLIIDSGPDFREQMNREAIRTLDAVLYTHEHSDHVNGLDELRVLHFRSRSRVPIYANTKTLEDLERRFPYLFHGGSHALYPPVLAPHEISPAQMGERMTIGDITFIPFLQDHGTCQSLGYRFGNFAYSLDFIRLPEESLKILKGVETWIADCAAYHQADNPVHANLKAIYALNERVQAKTVYLSSLSLAMDYQTLCRELPEGYFPAYDGLTFKVCGD